MDDERSTGANSAPAPALLRWAQQFQPEYLLTSWLGYVQDVGVCHARSGRREDDDSVTSKMEKNQPVDTKDQEETNKEAVPQVMPQGIGKASSEENHQTIDSIGSMNQIPALTDKISSSTATSFSSEMEDKGAKEVEATPMDQEDENAENIHPVFVRRMLNSLSSLHSSCDGSFSDRPRDARLDRTTLRSQSSGGGRESWDRSL